SAAAQRFEVPVLPAFNFNALTPANAEGLNTIVDGPALLMNHRDDEAHNPGTNDPSQDFLDLYTLDINWADPTQSQLAGPTSIPIGEFDSHLCGYLVANVCFPQPGTGQLLDPVREVIMNRLVYRQFEDYASLVGSFVTDVDGTDHGGVRWFELRKTNGFWFLYQEGTYAPDSAHRWISSSSVDGDGNILLGYNITDASSIFPGLRFNGRYAQDPPGVFTLGENNIVEGTAAATTSRWGDYAGASLDPEDERTFWFTGQYQAALWATRIISLRLCDPPPAPTNLQAVANGTNRIDLTWTSANSKVAIYRAEDTCPAPGAFQKIAGPLTAASYSDLNASGGTTYAYFV
ncbi:MAG: hypothetical protein KDC71_24810, partial [Acidobacteria bacterium]|nr:hypothetical protein [Acidobacteriota bacterium]